MHPKVWQLLEDNPQGLPFKGVHLQEGDEAWITPKDGVPPEEYPNEAYGLYTPPNHRLLNFTTSKRQNNLRISPACFSLTDVHLNLSTTSIHIAQCGLLRSSTRRATR